MRVITRCALIASFVVASFLHGQEALKKADAPPPERESLEEIAPKAAVRGGSPTDAPRPVSAVANSVVDGTNGDVIMNSPAPFTVTGVVMQAKPSWPYIVAKTGTSDPWSGFAVYNSSNTELMQVRSDGNVGIGTAAPGAKLHVFGSEFLLSNAPPDATTGSVTMFSMGNRAASGGTYLWRLATASSAGGSGVYPNAFDLYEYPSNPSMYCCFLRMSIRPLTTETPKLIVVDGAGNFGVGVWSPAAALHVNGNGLIEGTLTVTGDITGARVVNATYRDLAEWVTSDEPLTDGSVVTVALDKDDQVVASTQAYDTRVAGVVSPTPGVLLGEPGESRYKVATTGRVKVKVDATRAPIHKGDLLVSSDIPGVAMKSQPVDLGGVKIHRPGTLIGKALESLESGKGEILVLLSLQ